MTARSTGPGVGHCGADVSARPDAELGEDLTQVPLDGVGAEEQLGADLRVGQPVGGQLRDLRLLRGQRRRDTGELVRIVRPLAPVASSSRRAPSLLPPAWLREAWPHIRTHHPKGATMTTRTVNRTQPSTSTTTFDDAGAAFVDHFDRYGLVLLLDALSLDEVAAINPDAVRLCRDDYGEIDGADEGAQATRPGRQDECFIPTRDRSLTAVWIAVDDATVENGCLWVLPPRLG